MSKGALRYSSLGCMPDSMRAAVERQHGQLPPATPREPKARAGKYNAKPTHSGGIRFDSKREARYFERLNLLQQSGEVSHFHRQVIFDLEGGVVYRCDFQVIFADGRVEYHDAKGFETKEFRIKRRMVRARYGVEIVTV